MVSLDGVWKLAEFKPGEGERAGAHRPEFDDGAWIPAAVPGDVHSALAAAGRIPPPFDGRNLDDLLWIEQREWWYRTTVECPAEELEGRIALEFDGLDTFATIYVNGHEVGRSANMLVPARFEAGGTLRPGEPNTIAIRFDSTPLTIAEKPSDAFWSAFDVHRPWVRKAGMNFGWDWGPRAVTAGIWRSARLAPVGDLRIETYAVRTHAIDERGAVVTVGVWVVDDAPTAAPRVRVTLDDGERSFVGEAEVCGGAAEVRLVIPQPRLWWSHDHGEPYLHLVRVELVRDGHVVDVAEDRVGLRTVQVLQAPDPDGLGKSFTVVLNGRPVFCKGADWIPVDSFIGAAPPDRYHGLVEMAREANMNMLRVWGGGVYEHDAFYQACDELGVLIWQDFMFSCACYPDFDGAFVAEVAREADLIVKRLRNRACIALWCGNNENDWIDDQVHASAPDKPYLGRRIYHEILPQVCARLDPTRFYWPSSPYGGNDHNSECEGDRHNWQVWAGQTYPRRFGEPGGGDATPEGVSFRHYAEDECRFCSEFGIHASPIPRTLSRHIPPGELAYDSEQFLYRIKDVDLTRKERMMAAHIGTPRDFDEYVTMSMLVQAEGLKYGIEHYRCSKFHCSGTLFWQLNDCWPGISWSVIDYYLNPKAGYYYAKRVYAPLLVCFQAEEDGVSLWAVNDRPEPFEGRARVALLSLTGDTRWEATVAISVPANTAVPVALSVGAASAATLAGPRPNECLIVEPQDGGAFDRNVWFFGELKDTVLLPATVGLTMESAESSDGVWRYRATLTSDVVAHFVGLEFPCDRVLCSANYVTLLPGQPTTIDITSPKPIRPGEIVTRRLNPGG